MQKSHVNECRSDASWQTLAKDIAIITKQGLVSFLHALIPTF